MRVCEEVCYVGNLNLKMRQIWKQQSNGSPKSEQNVKNVVKTSEKEQGQLVRERQWGQDKPQTRTQINTAKK